METTSTATGASAAFTARSWVGVVRTWLPLTAVVLCFFVLSSAYNAKVPLYEAPDEAGHARVAGYIRENNALPEFENISQYESWQPPLYYTIGAAALKGLRLESPPVLEHNPDFHFPQKGAEYLHSSDEDFPYSEPVRAVHVLRGVSTMFSAATLVFIYLIALALFPARKLLATTAAATAAFVPQFAFISGMVTNDPAGACLCAATVYFGIRFLKDEQPIWMFAAALAVSFAALAKLNAVVGGVVPLGAVLLSTQPWNTKGKYMALLALAPLLLAGWFYVRSLVLWGALLPADRFWQFQGVPPWHHNYIDLFFQDLRKSFWYMGGPMVLRMAPIVYDILDVLSVLGVAGVIVAFRSGVLSRVQKYGLILLALLPLLALIAIIQVSTVDYQNQGRYLFTAMPAIAILLPLGISTLFARDARQDHPAMLALPVTLIAVNIGIFTTILPGVY